MGIVSAITKIITAILGILLIIIDLIGIPLPILPGFIFIILGAGLLGYPVASTIRKYIKKAKKIERSVISPVKRKFFQREIGK